MRNKFKCRKIRIGFFAPNIDNSTSLNLLSGVVEKARELNVDLVTFVGERINEKENFKFQANKIYKLAESAGLDGLIIWASAISTFLSDADLKKFIDQFKGLPVITLGKKVESCPVLMFDNYESMKDLIVHLVKAHGYKKIGFINGPVNYYYAKERYRAYCDALKEFDIKFDEKFVTPPLAFDYKSGKTAVNYFIDENKFKPKIDIEAIVSVNDLIAVSCIRELLKRRIKVPEDIAVTGFNNNLDCKTIVPFLTSVDNYLNNFGRLAVDKMYAMISGEEIESELMSQSKLIIRESCGCSNKTVSDKFDNKNAVYKKKSRVKSLAVFKDGIISGIKEMLLRFLPQSRVLSLSEQIFDIFMLDASQKSNDVFVCFFRSILYEFIDLKIDFLNWYNLIIVFHTSVKYHLTEDSEDLSYIDDVFGKAKVCVLLTLDYFNAKTIIDDQYRTQLLLDSGQEIITNLELNDLLDIVNKEIPKLNIKSCFIYLYENKDELFKSVRPIFAYHDADQTAGGSTELNPSEIIPENVFNETEPVSLIVMPLYFKENDLGYVIFSMGPADGAIYHLIRVQLCGALQEVSIFEALRNSERNRAELLSSLEDRNIELNKAMKRLWSEMEVAKKIQTSILPKEFNIKGYEISAFARPADEVGGDYYDIIEGGDDCHWVTIGDVSGHGVTAGLVMMMLQTTVLNCIFKNPEIMPDDLINTANRTVYYNIVNRLKFECFITCCFFRFNNSGDFLYSGAHESILIYRAAKKQVEEIITSGMWIGIMEDLSKFNKCEQFKLEKDDVLLLYTDGVVDISNNNNELYSISRLKAFFKENGGKTTDDLLKDLIADLDSFKIRQQDDISFVILRKL